MSVRADMEYVWEASALARLALERWLRTMKKGEPLYRRIRTAY
jgi:hypothetical protein